MRKNNKGFTLIELLAAIAILSILMVFSLPQITNLIGKNRDKVYISDALKMISQAEYKLRTNSTIIEKPDEGECIVFSLNYLDNNSFDNPPNKGEYLRYASFVVVKNDGGKLEYSALLVEEYDNSYKGVKLTKESDLNKSDATKNVTPFDKDSLVYINDDISNKYTDGVNKTIDIDFINKYLGDDYVSAIDDRLVNDTVEQDEDVENLGVPRINSFVTMSASGKDFNSLDMKILVEAKDSDTPASNLRVYYNICTPKMLESNPKCEYPDITNPSVSSLPYSTGGSSTFTSQTINLNRCNTSSDYCANYGDEVIVYLIVADDEGNYTNKQKKYTIHTNEAPKIRRFEITRRDSDPANFLKAKAIIDVDDDIDGYGTLQWCILNDKDGKAEDCAGKFQVLTTDSYSYDFCTGEVFSAECMPDGSTRSVKLFVKDSLGKVSSATFDYPVYNLNISALTPTFSVTSSGSDVPTGEKSLNVRYTIKVPFDPNSGITENDITYTVGVCESESSCDSPIYLTSPIKYSEAKSGNYKMYSTNQLPLYDGINRRIVAKVYINKYGLNSPSAQLIGKVVNYEPYTNLPPKVNKDALKIVFLPRTDSFGDQKSPQTGTYNVKFKFTATDDLDGTDFWVCMKENKEDCNYSSESDFKGKYQKYQEENEFTFSPTNIELPYDGSSKTLNIKLCDKYYLTKGINSCSEFKNNYTVYKNVAPEITDLVITSAAEGYNSYKTHVRLELADDLEDVNDLEVTLTDGTNTVTKKYSEFVDSTTDFEFADQRFDGKTRELTVTVTDSYGDSSSKSGSYRVSLNNAPVIKSFVVERTSDVWRPEYPINSSMTTGSYESRVILNITDQDVWDDGELKYCISENASGCTDDEEFSLYDPNDEINYIFTPPAGKREYETADSRILYLTVRDLLGKEQKKDYVYDLYQNQGPYASTTPIITPDYSSFTEKINLELDSIPVNKINVSANFIDDIDEDSNLKVRIGYKKRGESEFTYSEDVNYSDIMSFTIGDPESFVYDGSTYDIIVQGKDSYGKYTDTYAQTSYTVYDKKIELIKADLIGNCEYNVDNDGYVIRGEDGTPSCSIQLEINSSKFFISAQIKDYFDSYEMCVSESDTECSDYTNKNYSGGDPYTSHDTKLYELNNSNYTGESPTPVYLYIKEKSTGKVEKFDFNYNVYKVCSKTYEQTISYTPVDKNHIITPIECEGKCYVEYNEKDEIISTPFIYNRKYDTYDFYNSTHKCETDLTSENEKLYCSYDACFYNKDGNPTYNLIGLVVKTDKDDNGNVIEYTYNYGDSSYKFKEYHTLYKLVNDNGSYKFASQNIKIPDNLIGNTDYKYRDEYPFDKNNDNSYLEFSDLGFAGDDEKTEGNNG